MTENPRLIEQAPTTELGRKVSEVFERRATHGGRELIVETYREKFNKLVATMPKENRERATVKIQHALITVGSYISEYGSRFTDFVRNIVLWPMVHATKDFPKDKYYQMSLARARAWGDFALNTTKTATAERAAYKNHLFASAVTGAGVVGVPTTIYGVATGAALGAVEGSKYGALVGGLYGAGIGAATGAAIGAGISLGLRLKDRIMGPPAVYYRGMMGADAIAASVPGLGIADVLTQ